MSELRRLAADLGHAAATMPGEAATAVRDAASGAETQARALDVERGVVVVQPSPTSAVIASTQRYGVYGNAAPAPPPRADLTGVADTMAGRLLDAGVGLIVQGHA